MEHYYSRFGLFRQKMIEKFYNFLRRNSNSSRYLDPLLLINNVSRKNAAILGGLSIDFEDHILGRYEKTETVISTVLKHYKDLSEGKKHSIT